MSMAEQIRSKLSDAFQPVTLNVIDESEDHRGHGGWREGGETHFRVEITASAFDGKSRVAQQRAVYAVLKEELKAEIHALALDVKGVTK